MSEFNRFLKWKVLLYSDRLQTIAEGGIPSPIVWHIYPSNVCNLNCSFCIMKKEKTQYPTMLPEKTMKKIPLDAYRNGVKIVHFSGGGSPLLHPLTRSISLELQEQYNVRTALSTNGVLLEPDDATVFSHIRVSLDASTPSTYEKIKGSPHFDKVVENVRKLVDFKKENNSHVDIGLGFVVGLENLKEVYDFDNLGYSLGVDFIHIRPCFYGDSRDSQLNEILTLHPIHIPSSHSKSFYIDYKIKNTWNSEKIKSCLATPLQAVLSATGEFVICQDVFIRWGNYNNETFKQIWYSKKHLEAIKKIDLNTCPRCVEGFHNEVLEKIFLSNQCRNELI